MTLPAAISPLAPEIALLASACVLLIVDTISRDEGRRTTWWLSMASLALAAALVLLTAPAQPAVLLHGHYIADAMSTVLKTAICLVTIVVYFYSYEYYEEHGLLKGEFFVLGLFAVLGMMVLVSAYSLLTVYLGLELLSLSLYALVAMHRESGVASEAAMKYFVLGALASGMLLYGMSMLYGAAGTLDLPALSAFVANEGGHGVVLVFGLAFVLVGIGFKLGAVPFHMWVPDVYEGAPTAVTLFIASAPKIAAFAMAMRLLVDGLAPLFPDWQGMLIVLSLLSMAAGNVIAIAQTNIKRMLGYSTIAHVGFLLLGILSGTKTGYAGSMFYIVIYALMSIGAFGMVILLGRANLEADKLEDFRGLSRRSPWFAFVMLILMFSMAGVPPFAGFWAKWFVITEVIAAGQVWLAVVAVVFSVIGAYYYLRIVKLMYFDEPVHMTALKASQEMRFVLSLNGLAVLVLGFVPGVLMAVCVRAFGG